MIEQPISRQSRVIRLAEKNKLPCLREVAAMGEQSRIEWTTHTFNPWWGCVKVSAACKNCYAEAFARRLGQTVWGPKSERRFFGDKHWSEPLSWNHKAMLATRRDRVFCASMADVFEDRRDLDEHRARLWLLIEATPWLDWLVLTKRPQNIRRMAKWGKYWPANLWIGTTIEDQEAADTRLPILTRVQAPVRFISAEPLVGPLDLAPYITRLDWVITGGESGVRARPSSPADFRHLRDQCQAAGVAFHFKQWGEYAPDEPDLTRGRVITAADGTPMRRVGKTAAGRLLDGVTWDELPISRRLR